MYESDPSSFMGSESPQDWRAPSTSYGSTETSSSFSSGGTEAGSGYTTNSYTSQESSFNSGQSSDFYNPLETVSRYSNPAEPAPVEVASATGKFYESSKTNLDPFYISPEAQIFSSVSDGIDSRGKETEASHTNSIAYHVYEREMFKPGSNSEVYKVPQNSNSMLPTLYKAVGAKTPEDYQAVHDAIKKTRDAETLNHAWFKKECGNTIIAAHPSESGTLRVNIVRDPNKKNQGDYYCTFAIEDMRNRPAKAQATPKPTSTPKGSSYSKSTPTSHPESTKTAVPESVSSPTPKMTPTPESTPIPEMTPTPEATPIPEMTPTPEATPVSEALSTPEMTPTAESTPIPEMTPTAESTPIPEMTPTPESTPMPEALSSPGMTPTPEATPTPEMTPTPTTEEQAEITNLTGDLHVAYDEKRTSQGKLEKEPQGKVPEYIEAHEAHQLLTSEKATELMTEFVKSNKKDITNPEVWSQAIVKEMRANEIDLNPRNLALVGYMINRESGFEAEPRIPNFIKMKKTIQQGIMNGEYDDFQHGKLRIRIPKEDRAKYCKFIDDTLIKYDFVQTRVAEDEKKVAILNKNGSEIAVDKTERDLADRLNRNIENIIKDARKQNLDKAVTAHLIGKGVINDMVVAGGRWIISDASLAKEVGPYLQPRTYGPMQVNLDKARNIAMNEGRYTNDEDLKNELYTIEGGLHYGLKLLHAAAEPYLTRTDIAEVEKMQLIASDYNAGAWSSRNAQFQKCLNKLFEKDPARENLALDGDLLRYNDGVPSAGLTAASVKSFVTKYGLNYSDDEIMQMLSLEKSADFEKTGIWADVRNEALRLHHGEDPDYYLPYATIPIGARADKVAKIKFNSDTHGAEKYSAKTPDTVEAITNQLLRMMNIRGLYTMIGKA